jgi:hypothetical protein
MPKSGSEYLISNCKLLLAINVEYLKKILRHLIRISLWCFVNRLDTLEHVK